jgi:PAS domain S-box-containing protein
MSIPSQRGQSTRARLILLVLMVAVPAFLLQVIGAWIDLQQNISNRKHDAGQIAIRARGKFETLLDTSRSVFTELVRLPEMRTPDSCTLLFNDLHLAYERLAPDATNVGLSDANGNIYCAVNPVLGNKVIADQPHFLRAIRTLDMALGDYTLNPATGLPNLSVAYPVLSFDGKVQTVIFINYELLWLENWQKEISLPADTALTLISPDGNILQRYLNEAIIPGEGNADQTKWFAPLQNGQDGIEAIDLDGVIRYHTLVPLQLGSQTAAWLHLGYPVAEIYTQAEQALTWRLSILSIIFIIALVIAWWGSHTLFLHPLNSMMRVVEKVQQGDLSARAASIPAVGELTGLAESFDHMTESLQQRESAQQEAQTELRESEARFRAMFESSAMGVVILDLRNLTVRYNPVSLLLLDDPKIPTTLNDPYEFINAQYREAERKTFTELLNGHRDSYTTDHSYHKMGEDEVWSHVTISAIKDDQGGPRYIVAMMENITEQKKDQQKLHESEARFRAMYDNAAVGMAMMSLDRKIISMNQTAAIMTGYTLEELYGSDPSRLSHPDDIQTGMEQFSEMVTGNIPGFQMEKRFVRKNGEIFWGRVTYSVVPDDNTNPKYLVGIIEDITEQRQASQKLAEQQSEYRRTLEQRVEERTHELGEANQRLMDEINQRKRAEEALALKAAEDAVTAERTRLARDLHDAVTQTLFSASIIAEVLPELWQINEDEAKKSSEELGQLTRGALAEMRTLLLELRPAALTQSRLTDLIRQLCDALIGRARLPIKFTSEGDRTLPPEVQVAFYRIAQESLNNVFKYARATQVNVSLFFTPAGAQLEVCDNGVGFDMSKSKPTSLGMQIMRERAEAIGAALSIASKPGEGVCLNLTWTERPDMKLSVFKS